MEFARSAPDYSSHTRQDKTLLAPLRLLDVLSLAYLLLSSDRLRVLAGQWFFRPLEICGRHSLEVFAVGCIAALFGRLLFRTYGAGIEAQIAINVVGIAMMCMVGLWLEKRRTSRSIRSSPGLAWLWGHRNSVPSPQFFSTKSPVGHLINS